MSVFFLGFPLCSVLFCISSVAMPASEPPLLVGIPPLTHQGLISGGSYYLAHENVRVLKSYHVAFFILYQK